MLRYFYGLPFIVHGPAHFEFNGSNEVIAKAEIFFDGSWWVLQATLYTGRVLTREFVSRDAAMRLVAGRAAA